MLILAKKHLKAIYEHGEKTFPYECCGILLGKSNQSIRTVELVCLAENLNQERKDRYEMSPKDRLKIEEQANQEGFSVIGFYHSHPDHDAYFSQTDLEGSEEYRWGKPWLPPSYSYLVASIREGTGIDFKSFLIQDGQSVEEEVSLQ